MRVAVVDIGTNSTRLLVADADPATRAVVERDRRTTVTRLGHGVDADGTLRADAMDRVFATLAGYREAIDALGVERTIAVLTSAVRDAANGREFAARVAADFDLDARILSGDDEARMTFLGVTSGRADSAPDPLVVVDIGGGSTEFVVGHDGIVDFHVSTQAGVVRHAERHIHHDPPEGAELRALAEDARATFATAVPDDVARRAVAAIAVAGTATSLAAIDQELEPYDSTRVHGYRLARADIEMLLARLAQMTVEERRHVRGLHPDRAPAIVPGAVLMLEALDRFGLDDVEVSEHDILRGAALTRAAEA